MKYAYCAILLQFLLSACSKNCVKIYDSNKVAFNETAETLTVELIDKTMSNRCSNDEVKEYYLTNTNYIRCYDYQSTHLRVLLQHMFSDIGIDAILGDDEIIYFYCNSKERFGISTNYSLVYSTKHDALNYFNADENAEISQINDRWYILTYENDD